jgi:ParB family chromosome partitioning protein
MATAVKETAAPAGEYQLAPIGIVVADKGFNNRRTLGNIDELTNSIQSVGVLQPLLVWRRELGAAATDGSLKDKGFLHVIAGHRRLAASLQAGLTHVPVIVVEQDERARLESLLVENLHRLDIDPLEEADGYKRLLAFGLKQKEIASKVGRAESHVSKRLSLLELPKEVHDLVVAGKLRIADALELTPYAKEPEVIEETLKQLKESIRMGWGFRVADHALGAKRRIEREAKKKSAIEHLTAAKVAIVKSNPWNLTGLGKGYGQLPITAAAHSKFDCHAAFVEDDGEVRYLCTKPATHAKSDDKAVARVARQLTGKDTHSADNKAQAKKAAESRERNKVLRIREPLRLAEVKRVLTARQKREDVLDFTLRQLLQLLVNSDYEVGERAAAFLEIPMSAKKHTYDRANPEYAAYLSGGNDRVFKLAYAFALASGEEPFAKLMKQGYFDQEYSTNATRYLDHLEANGYKPDKVELAQLPKRENGYRWKDAFDQVQPKGKAK